METLSLKLKASLPRTSKPSSTKSGKDQWHSPAVHEWLWHFLFTIYDSQFTALIGSDRSAFAATCHKRPAIKN
jgi:hypothetical protein